METNPSIVRISSVCVTALATTFLTGCIDPYVTHYVAETAAGSLECVPSTSKAPLRVIKTSNLRADILRLQALGYVVLGHSAFQPKGYFPFTGPDWQAKAVGADIVLLRTKYLGTTQVPGGYGGGAAVGSEESAFASPGGSWNPGYSYDTYRYVAVFLRQQTAPVSPKQVTSAPAR
jgi:hypothetical protein